jgi:hypothetical protein
LTIPNGDNDVEELLYLDFQFSPKKVVTLQDVLAAARSEWKHKNLVLADPEKFLLDVRLIDWEYVGVGKVDFMGEEVGRCMAKSKNSKGTDLLKCFKERIGVGVRDGDRVVVLPYANGKCKLYRTTPTPSKDTLQSLFHRVNEFHANVGVELKALPEIKSIEWSVEGKKFIIPLSMLPSNFPTVRDLKQAIINSVRCPSRVKYNLVISTPGGDTWRQEAIPTMAVTRAGIARTWSSSHDVSEKCRLSIYCRSTLGD